MKKHLLLALLAAGILRGQVPEKVLVIEGFSPNEVTARGITPYLLKGWTVKHQSVSCSGVWWVMVFTLSPPTPEVQALLDVKQAAEQRRLEFEKRREEYLKKVQDTKVEGDKKP